MEVMVPVVVQEGMDFDFNSARTTPYPTAPSTPSRLGEYYHSAPTSPGPISDFYREFDLLLIQNEVPIDWDEKTGVPKSPKGSISIYEDDDFAFDLSGDLHRTSLSAEELFDGGVIKPIKPLPIEHQDGYSGQVDRGLLLRSPSKSLLGQSNNIFGAAIEDIGTRELVEERERGRERSYVPLSSSSCIRSAARSEFPPIHVSATTNSSTLSTLSKSFTWKLKDLFLFRSASDGRAMAKDPLKKYSNFIKKQEDLMSTSSRAIESTGSTSSRRRGNVSAHELHYTVNRAYSEDMKKKTFLPYKKGILGRLSFNPTIPYSFGFKRK